MANAAKGHKGTPATWPQLSLNYPADSAVLFLYNVIID